MSNARLAPACPRGGPIHELGKRPPPVRRGGRPSGEVGWRPLRRWTTGQGQSGEGLRRVRLAQSRKARWLRQFGWRGQGSGDAANAAGQTVMNNPDRGIGRVGHTDVGHRRTESRMIPETIARLGAGNGKRRQRLQHERIDEHDAHHIARQLPKSVPPVGTSHGLPAVISDETLTRLPWRRNVQREGLDRRRARVYRSD